MLFSWRSSRCYVLLVVSGRLRSLLLVSNCLRSNSDWWMIKFAMLVNEWFLVVKGNIWQTSMSISVVGFRLFKRFLEFDGTKDNWELLGSSNLMNWLVWIICCRSKMDIFTSFYEQASVSILGCPRIETSKQTLLKSCSFLMDTLVFCWFHMCMCRCISFPILCM